MRARSLFKLNRSGVALVAVLAILVVLALMAATFTIVIHQNMSMSRLQNESLTLDMLLRNGLAHAQSVLTVADPIPGKNPENPEPVTASHLISDNAFKPGLADVKKFGPWIYVRDEEGYVHGRYRVRIEDEAAKVNLNKAYLNTQSRGHGWDTGEIYLPHALGVSKKAGQSIINYKYGDDRLPGGRGDDDHNNPRLMVDGLDNTGDGTVDEYDEGVNDPREYSAMHPRGDDRAFVSFREAMPFIMNVAAIRKMSEATRQAIASEISKRATLYSVDLPGSPTLPTDEPSDINSVTARECRRRLLTANEQIPFESSSSKRNQIAANIIDYRDENHVLTTLGGQAYGVEAICFNEVMANEDSAYYWCRDGFATDGLVDDWVSRTYWVDNYGGKDNSRMIYAPSYAYSASHQSGVLWDTISKNKTWLILDDGRKKYGSFKVSGGSIVFELPPGPGKFGSATRPLFEGVNWGGNDGPKSYKETYERMMKLMSKRGKTINGHTRFPANFFKNQEVYFYDWGGSYIGKLKVKSSTPDHRFTATGGDVAKIASHVRNKGVTNLGVSFSAWTMGLTANLPEVSIYHVIRSRSAAPGKYYKIQISRDQGGPWQTWETDTLNASGVPASGSYTVEDDKIWYYNSDKPIRTDPLGWIDVFVTSSPKVRPGADIFQSLSYIRLMAPEVVEMYNASDTPISLANWRVICNTGSLATEIGRIKKTAYYDTILKRQIIDDNPIVRPRGHFYLVNDTELFDARYGNADNKWGSRADEQVPVFEMDKKHWGVSFKISKVETDHPFNFIYLENESFDDPELFQGETIRLLYEGKEQDKESWHGALIPAMFWEQDGGVRFRIWNEYAYQGSKPAAEGGRVMVIGLPARGGIVSLTLKNEYEQVTSRTIEYGAVEKDEIEYSTEKEDPTHYTWVKRSVPTIGGTETEALNRSMQGKKSRPAWIKNGPFGSVAELALIRTADDFENVGTTGGKSTGERKVGSLADVFCTSQVRLESCGENVETKGWEKALYEVGHHDLRTVTARDADWEVDQWKGHTLRFLTGPLRGQKFPVISNTRNSLMLAEVDSEVIPRSAPARKTIRNCKGAKFTVGPGYQTPFCYARQSDQEGEWLWRKAIPVPGTYDLYIYGLNDSIKTTEFLEENLNASIDTALWNYDTERWDTISTRKKYRKEDCFNAGKITPAHMSPDGDVRMKLTAHDVAETGLDARQDEGGVVSEYQSGYAWFNYAVVTPLPVVGRVNVNTAPARLLESMPGITPEVAKNIEKGIDAQGVAGLKPYTKLSDLFEVKGFTVEMFQRCANLLAINSYAYTVEVEAETLKDINNDGKYSMDLDRVNAARKKRYVMELNPVPNGYSKVRQVEKY
jgi:hypothetical protein